MSQTFPRSRPDDLRLQPGLCNRRETRDERGLGIFGEKSEVDAGTSDELFEEESVRNHPSNPEAYCRIRVQRPSAADSGVKPRGLTLIETMITVVVVSLSLLGVIKLMSANQRSLTESMESLQAQASAEELLQRIRLMRWDANAPPTGPMPLAGTAVPKADCGGVCPDVPDRTAIEHWSRHSDTDNSRQPYGAFARNVRVRFLTMDGQNRLIESSTPTDRKEVTIWAVGRNSSATITSVFYNLP